MIPKFRGRCHDGGWIHGSCVKFDENTCFIMPEFGGASILSYAQIFNHTAQYVDIETIGQSTGLKDKNDVEIFEGDIVKCTVDNWSNGEKFEQIDKVVYEDCMFTFSDGFKYDCSINHPSYLNKEVIGNIFENPELLKVR